MTNEQKPREFWITDPECYSEDYIHTVKEEAVHSGDFIIHVIEYSALEKLQKENEVLWKGLEWYAQDAFDDTTVFGPGLALTAKVALSEADRIRND